MNPEVCSDVCFIYGIAGKCGPECPDFGLREYCADTAEECLDSGLLEE